VRRADGFPVLVRDPAAGGSFEEWPALLGPEGITFTQSPPPARRLQLRFLLPGARVEVRGEGEVLKVDRVGDVFRVHARLLGLDDAGAGEVARWLEGA